MEKNSKIYVAGHKGLVGSSITRKLESLGYNNLIKVSRSELDLMNQAETTRFFSKVKPDFVICAAAKVGGILANSTQKADFIYENLQVQNNLIFNSYKSNVKKLLFLGSSCIYPRDCPQPIKEEFLLNGQLEKTNDAYAVAKIAGIITCQSFNAQYKTNFISVMPTNLYGINDNFNLTSAHVLPAMMRKFHEAKISNNRTVTLWGTGSVKREFLNVDDMADACIFLMNNYNSSKIVNIGTGEDITIKELAELISVTVGYNGKIIWDDSKPDGTPRKLLDVSYLHSLGWHHSISLRDGLKSTYDWFLNNYGSLRQ